MPKFSENGQFVKLAKNIGAHRGKRSPGKRTDKQSGASLRSKPNNKTCSTFFVYDDSTNVTFMGHMATVGRTWV